MAPALPAAAASRQKPRFPSLKQLPCFYFFAVFRKIHKLYCEVAMRRIGEAPGTGHFADEEEVEVVSCLQAPAQDVLNLQLKISNQYGFIVPYKALLGVGRLKLKS